MPLDITPPPATDKAAKLEKLGKLVDLFDRQGIDINEVGQIKRVSVYQSLTKNEEGEAEIHDLMGVQFSPAWETGPEWPVIQQGPAIKSLVSAPSVFSSTLPGVASVITPNVPPTVSPMLLNSAATTLCSSWYFVMPDKSNKSNPNAFCKLSNLPKTKVTPCITEFLILIQIFLKLSLNAFQLS